MIVPSGPVGESLGLEAGAGREPEVDDQFGGGAVGQSAGRQPGRGICPVTCSQVVPHGRPQVEPISTGSYVCSTASANGTGSPGASQPVTVTGAAAR